MVAINILGALGTQLFPPQYVGLLGFLPIILGRKAWFDYHNKEKTKAIGADNIGVYIPVFSQYDLVDFFTTLIIFAGMIYLWCYIGHHIANISYVRKK